MTFELVLCEVVAEVWWIYCFWCELLCEQVVVSGDGWLTPPR